MSTRCYPLYQRGNPRLRVFLPNFWMKLVRSEEPLPPNVVLFQTSIEMTKYDVKNYLEKIYKVPVVDVRLTIKMGEIKPRFIAKGLIKDDDYKEALVFLPKGQEFVFPSNIGKDYMGDGIKEIETMEENYKKLLKAKKHQKYIPGWFAM